MVVVAGRSVHGWVYVLQSYEHIDPWGRRSVRADNSGPAGPRLSSFWATRILDGFHTTALTSLVASSVT